MPIIKITGEEAFRDLGSNLLSLPKTIDKLIPEAVNKSLHFIEWGIKTNIGNTFKKHARRTGHLAASWFIIPAAKQGNKWKGLIYPKNKWGFYGGSNLYYASRQEFGKYYVSQGKKMTIPITEAQPSYPPAYELKRRGKSFIKNNVIYLKRGKQKPLPIYFLRSWNRIPPRPYVKPVIQQYGLRIVQLLSQVIGTSVRLIMKGSK